MRGAGGGCTQCRDGMHIVQSQHKKELHKSEAPYFYVIKLYQAFSLYLRFLCRGRARSLLVASPRLRGRSEQFGYFYHANRCHKDMLHQPL